MGGFQRQTLNCVTRFVRAAERGPGNDEEDYINEIEGAITNMTSDCNLSKISNFIDPVNVPFFTQFRIYMAGLVNTKDLDDLCIRLKHILMFLKAAVRNEPLRKIWRDTQALMLLLSEVFSDKWKSEEKSLFMEVIELLSRDLVITWKAPYLVSLIKSVIHYLGTCSSDGVPLLHPLKFLLNISRNSQCTIMIIRADMKFKPVWPKVAKTFANSNNQASKRCQVIYLHLMFLIGSTIPIDNFFSGYELLKESTKFALSLAKEEGEEDGSVVAADLLHELTEFMDTIVENMKPTFQVTSSEDRIQNRFSVSHMSYIMKSKDKFVDTLSLLLKEFHEFIQTASGINEAVIEAVLKNTLVLVPPFVPIEQMVEEYKTALNIGGRALTLTKQSHEIVKLSLGIHQKIVEQALDKHNAFLFRKIDDHFARVLDVLTFSTNIEPQDVIFNTNLARLLFSLSSSLAGLREQIAVKLDGDLINFTNNIMDSETCAKPKALTREERMNRSVCVVEILCVLTQFTNMPEILDLFMKLVSVPNISTKVADCIRNGDERATTKALSIISSAPFHHNNLSIITKSLVCMQERTGGATSLPETLPVPQLSTEACVGANTLNAKIVMLEESLCGKFESSDDAQLLSSDLMSWYNIKSEVNRMEMENLNTQIFHQNQTILQLKQLLEKQDALLLKRVTTAERDDMDVLTLQHRLQDVSSELKLTTYGLQKELDEIKPKFSEVAKAAKEYQEKLEVELAANQNLKKEFAELKTANAELSKKAEESKESRKALRSDAARYKAELTQAKTKIASLEDAVKKKEEERVNAVMVLEKEKQMLDTIRGLVGKNFDFDSKLT